MPSKLNREQADTIIKMFDNAKDFEIDAENTPYGHISDEEIREAASSESVKEIQSKLRSDYPEFELEGKVEEFYTPLEIAISTNNKDAFDTLMSLGVNTDDLTTPEAVSMLGVALENYSLAYQGGNSKANDDAVHITRELIKKSSADILLNPMLPEEGGMSFEENKAGYTILSELACFEGAPDKSLYIETMKRLQEIAPDKMEAFVLAPSEDGDTVLHKLTSSNEREFADIILDALSLESAERVLTAKNDMGQNIRSNNYLSDDEGKKWYDQKLSKYHLEMDKKAKEAEEKLLAEEDAKQSEKLEQENKKKEKQRKKREKNKLKKKQALVSDDVQKEEELKDSEQIDESVTKDTIADSQNKSETKQGEPQTKIKVNEEIKPEAIKIKEETNEELYQRFFDSVTGDASLTKIGTIQKKINERNDRKGFDEFLARTIQNNTISNTLIDTIETDSRFRNDTGNVSSRSKKIEFFIDPTLKKIINSGAELQQQKTSDSVTNSSQSSPETTVDTKLESKSLDTTTPPSKEASVDEVGVEAKTTLIPANKAIKELSKYNRQLTREKVNLVQRLVQKDETIRYQQDEITRLSQQLYGFSQENQNLRTQNHNLFVQTQSQAVQINELLENNRSLHMAVNETQRTFQERYASKGTFDPNQFVQQRNEMNLANQAINSGENYRGNYFAAIDGELVNLSISQEAKGKGAQK